MRLLLVLVALLALRPALSRADGATWRLLGRGFNDVEIDRVASSPSNPRVLYAAAAQAVYRSTTAGQAWEPCFRGPSEARVNDLAVSPSTTEEVLAATDGGVFASLDGGRTWHQTFHAAAGTHKCLMVLFHPALPNVALLGTNGGLFISMDSGQHWQPYATQLNQHAVRQLVADQAHPERLYALTDRGLQRSTDHGQTWERVLVETPSNETATTDAAPHTIDEMVASNSASELTSLAIDPQNPDRLFLAAHHGLRTSRDGGRTWRNVAPTGPGGAPIRQIVAISHSPTVLFASLPDGVGRYDPRRDQWDILNAGLPTRVVYHLAGAGSGLLAATSQGLYSLDPLPELPAEPPQPADARATLDDFSHEPTIGQVQHEAVRYNDVEADKIRRWQRQASLRALLPSFNLDHDRKHDTYVSSIGSTTNPNFDRIVRADDPSNRWGYSLTWQLGDLIWNNDQTSIDVRSRLTLQLRDDLLNEVTRTYFERRRLQLELLNSPPTDPKVQLEKQLRLDELTAILDGLTGGWFSQQIHPMHELSASASAK